MRIFLTVLVATAIALPASAQVMGSTNRGAPQLTKGISFDGGGSLHLTYTAITMAGGKTMERVKSSENVRKFVNQRAAQSPLGEVEIKGKVTLGGKALPKGKHDLYFTVNEKAEWSLNLRQVSEDTEMPPLVMPIKLTEGKKAFPRLVIDLIPVSGSDAAELGISFGKSTGSVAVGS